MTLIRRVTHNVAMEKEALTAALEEIREARSEREDRLEALEEEASKVFADLDSLRTAEESILRLIRGPAPESQMRLPTAAPATKRSTNGKYPRTADAVYEVLRDNQGRRMTATRIQEILETQGKLNPDLKQPYGVVLESAKRLARRFPEVVMRRRNTKIYFSYRPPAEEKGERDVS